MSHPAASIKSIFSGKVNFDSPDYEYPPSDADEASLRLSNDSADSITSKNLATLADQQHINQGSDDSGDIPDLLSFSRPLSRNSTTSCLSTTATKDGIEGKRFHRHGPTPYSSNIIASMIHSQQQEKAGVILPKLNEKAPTKLNDRYVPSALTSFDPVGPGTGTGTDQSSCQISIKSTNAEFDGESETEEIRSSVVEKNLPRDYVTTPTLHDKLELLTTHSNDTQ